jgi:hypothetical protein
MNYCIELFWNVEQYPTERAGRVNVTEPSAVTTPLKMRYGSVCLSYRTKKVRSIEPATQWDR